MSNPNDTGAALAFMAVLPLIAALLFWLLCAGVAAAIAAERNRSALGFFFATFFFLGPFGIMTALLATRGELDQLPPPPRAAPLAMTPPKPPAPATTTGPALKVGDRVRVNDPGDKYNGRIGVVDEVTNETDGYNIYVAFGDDPKTRAFSQPELTLVRRAPEKPKGTPAGKQTGRTNAAPGT